MEKLLEGFVMTYTRGTLYGTVRQKFMARRTDGRTGRDGMGLLSYASSLPFGADCELS